MKKNFITGLIILLPLALTLAIVIFILNFLTQPFMGFLEQFLDRNDWSWYRKYYWLFHFAAQIFLLIVLFLLTVLLGILARAFVFKSILNVYEYVLHKIPIINTLYKTTKQVIKTVFGSSSKSFKQVVMVPFPKANSYSIGFLSGDSPTLCNTMAGVQLLSVFVPTTPNPTSGFLLMCPKEEVIFLDMKVEEAFKLIISCGVVSDIEEIPIK